MSISYINAIETPDKKKYDIYTADEDKDNIIDAAYNKVVNEALPGLQDAQEDLDVPDYLDKNTKKASLTIGNNHTSLQGLQIQIDTAKGNIKKCSADLEKIKEKVNNNKIPLTIDECPTLSPGELEIESNISSIKLTKPKKIPNRMYGTQSINKITCEILVDGELFSDDAKENYKDGVEITIPLPIGTNQALLPLQLGLVL